MLRAEHTEKNWPAQFFSVFSDVTAENALVRVRPFSSEMRVVLSAIGW
jgi:hypothetical protein